MRVTGAYLVQVLQGEPPVWVSLLDRAILAKPTDLEPIEIRYLRRRTGWTAVEVAQGLGVSSNVIVSRWESGVRRMPKPTERLFRLLVANALGVWSMPVLLERLKSPWRRAHAPLEIHLYPKKDHFEYRWAVPPRRLPKSMWRLFWDVRPSELDIEHHANYIITRVLEKGDLEDWNWLRWAYGEEPIASALNQKRKVTPATVHLWRNVLLAPVEKD